METYDAPPPAGVVLHEMTTDINAKVNAELRAVRAALGAAGNKSPALETGLYERLGQPTLPRLYLAPIEIWAEKLTEATTISSGQVYSPQLSDSQYKDSSVIGGLAKIMKVGGILIGVDKLGHFFQLGFNEYYKRTLAGTSRADAITEGNKTEVGMYGLGFTDVYSFADLAANQDGLRFYEDLRKTPSMSFDIGRYVSSRWNEQANANLYGGNLAQLWRNNLRGNWTGEMTWNGAPDRAALSATLDCPGARSTSEMARGIFIFSGTYRYVFSPAGNATGKLSGDVQELKNSDGAVYRLETSLDWEEGSSKGKGFLVATSMNRLEGTWGRLGSDKDGGAWWLTKT